LLVADAEGDGLLTAEEYDRAEALLMFEGGAPPAGRGAGLDWDSAPLRRAFALRAAARVGLDQGGAQEMVAIPLADVAADVSQSSALASMCRDVYNGMSEALRIAMKRSTCLSQLAEADLDDNGSLGRYGVG
jgi:hypothetical protein